MVDVEVFVLEVLEVELTDAVFAVANHLSNWSSISGAWAYASKDEKNGRVTSIISWRLRPV